ncbi:MAG TPA: DUF938 domain-containing protein [Pseudomonadales bacterium]|nr:DUF938 domain-containing protein [Pseudomonadales bacterium]
MKRDAPAAARNLEAIATVLATVLAGRSGHLLEIGSGTGQHAAGIAPRLPALAWWPTDPDPDQRASIDARVRETACPTLRQAGALDAARDWPLGAEAAPPTPLAAIFSANVIHISDWAVTEGILRNAGRHLAADGVLILYGPFARGGRPMAPSNADFDASLRSRNPAWGVRDLDAVEALAATSGLRLARTIEMPANNLINLFERDPASPGRAAEETTP